MISSPTTTEGWRWLQRISLRALLYAGFGVAAVAALVSLAGTLAIEGLTEAALTRYRGVDAPVSDLIARASDAFLQARRYEKDYFLSLRPLGLQEAKARYVTLWQTGVEDVLAHLAKVAELAGAERGELAARTTRNAALLKQYEGGFLVAVELTTTLGFVNTGIEGEMRRAAHALERQFLDAGAVELWGRLSQLRRLEKDFMLRGRAQYATAFTETAGALRSRVGAWRVPASQRETALSHLERYASLFERYVRLSGQLEEKRREYLAVAQMLEPDLSAMQYDALAASAQALSELDAGITRALRAQLAIQAALFVTALLTAYFVARLITSRTQRMVTFAEAVSHGDLNARLPLGAGRELRLLGEALNRMVDAVQGKNAARDRLEAEILKLNAELENRVGMRTAELESANQQLIARGHEIALASELTSALQSALTVDEAGALMARYLERLIPGASGGIYVAKPSGQHVELLASWRQAENLRELFTLEDCWALRRGQPYPAEDAQGGLTCAHAAGSMSPSLCIPLTAQAAMLGLLYLRFDSAADAGSQRRELVEQLARQISLALANLKLRDRLREQSIRDPLTGLYNRRYLEETLEREIARARREAKPLAVFMLDVDHFKKFNDTHGHEAGDEVLRALGRTLRSSCRAEDVVCRFGGEEFTAVLPGASQQAAADWAARFIARVRAMQVKATTLLPQVTVSLGLAVYPLHGEDADSLLQTADQALYQAKREGRDRMVAAPAGLLGAAPEERKTL